MSRLFTTTLFLFLAGLLFNSCKKGDGDPTLSLRTRKARMVGEWQLKFGTAGLTYAKTGSPSFNQSFVLDGNTAEESETPTGGTAKLYIFPYTLHLSIKKDGTFILSEVYGNYSYLASGNWNFTSGVGKDKNKESMAFVIDKVDVGTSDDHLFNKLSTEFTYHITTLKNKELVLDAGTKIYAGAGGEKISYSGTFNFVQ